MKVVIIIYSLIIGSFLNVCIYRIPLGISIAFPRSFCPDCRHTLKWYDMFPVISYLVLQGRCRNCKAPIHVQYPLVEILTAILCMALYLQFGLEREFFKYSILTCLLIVISGIDIQHYRIPNVLSMMGIVIGLILAFFLGKVSLFTAFLGMVVGGCLLLPIVYFYPQGMGMGDAKLLAMIGSFTGIKATLLTLFIGSTLGTLVGSILICCKIINRKTKIPFGPFLAVGTFIVIFLNI